MREGTWHARSRERSQGACKQEGADANLDKMQQGKVLRVVAKRVQDGLAHLDQAECADDPSEEEHEGESKAEEERGVGREADTLRSGSGCRAG